MKSIKVYTGVFMTVFYAAFIAMPAYANLAQMKVYKEVFEGEKPKCTTCHTDKTPKKDAGKHEWNEYGRKVREIKETPDADTYKTAGKNENSEE